MDGLPDMTPETVEPLSQANFIRLSRFVYDYCGIRITEKKRTMLDSRLRRRMRALGIGGINAYCKYLFDSGDANAKTEIVHFIDAITTNKTDFYRESAHFDYLRAQILPHLAESGGRTIRVWCAASSVGAEPYTLAMELEDFCQVRPGLSYTLVATDICTEVLVKAVAGRYPVAMMEPIPEAMRRKYIMVSRDPNGREFRIVPRLRAKVSFQHLNLMDERYPQDQNFDVIFCRNTLIYFDRDTQIRVLQRLCDHLRRGGHLVLGHSENITGAGLPLKSVANTIFRRV